MKSIVIFASGSGTNAENIIRYFEDSDLARVNWVITNNPKAGVLDRVHKLGVSTLILQGAQMEDGFLHDKLQRIKADLIVLAGFLKKIPSSIIEAYPQRIINIHPSLLPDYGGPGMYGARVHQAVIDNEEELSGVTIHYVDQEYDEGEIIFQEEVEVDYEDSWEDLQYKVQQLEYKHYPAVIEYLLTQLD